MNNKQTKALQDYMKLPYTIVMKRDEEGDVIARIKEFEGCVADGQDEMEALSNLEHVKAMWITACLNSGTPIPSPENEENLPSGKWLQRVPRSLHQKLTQLAENEGVSLNQLVTSVLAEAFGNRTQTKREVVEHTSAIQIQAGAYTITAPRTKLSVVPRSASGSHKEIGDSDDLPQLIEFAASQIPWYGEQVRFVSMRNASGY